MFISTDNRRRLDRVPFFAPVTVVVLAGGPTIRASTRDISRGGAGLVAGSAPALNRLVLLAFHLGNGPGRTLSEEVVGRVAYVRSDEDATEFGVDFLGLLDEVTTPVLLAKILAA